MTTRTTHALIARGGWGHSSPASGDDGRSMSIRLEDPGNGSTIIELDIPSSVMLDLLTNTHRTNNDEVSMTVYELDAIGKRRDLANIIIDRPATYRCEEGYRKGSNVIALDALLKRDLEEHGWTWDESYNGHRTVGDGYDLHCSRLVGQDAPHPSVSLEEMLRRGLIQRGTGRTVIQGGAVPAESVTVEPPALRMPSGEKAAGIAKGTAPKRPRKGVGS